MSGGQFDYNQYKIDQIACDIEQFIINNNSQELNEWGSKKGREYSHETIEEFRKAVKILQQAYVYAQRIDWLLSSDDSEDTFHKRLKEDLDKLC